MASVYDIELNDVVDSYKFRAKLHNILNEKFNEAGEIYGGRSFFTDFDMSGAVKSINFGSDVILPIGSDFAYTPHSILVKNGYGGETEMKYGVRGLYKKLTNETKKLQREILEEVYDNMVKAANKKLMKDFVTYNIDGDLRNIIKVCNKLTYDVKSIRNTANEAKKIIDKAVDSFNRELKKKTKKELKKQPQYILSMNQLIDLGMLILTKSTEYCPIETGNLRASGTLIPYKDYIEIVYRCPYAIYVHENVNAVHPFGRAKFLETAVKETLNSNSIYVALGAKEGEFANFEWLHFGNGLTSRDAYLVKRERYLTIYVTIDRNLIVNRSDTI